MSVSLYFYSQDNATGETICRKADAIDCEPKRPIENCDLNIIEKSYFNGVDNGTQPQFSFAHAIARIKEHIIVSYSNIVVVQWSILWAISMCGFLQVNGIYLFHYIYRCADSELFILINLPRLMAKHVICTTTPNRFNHIFNRCGRRLIQRKWICIMVLLRR